MKKLRTYVLGLVVALGLSSCGNPAEATPVEVKTTTEEVESQEVTQDESDEFTIIEVTDIHYISNNINDKGEAFQTMLANADGRETYYIEELTDALVYEIQQMQPDVMIVSGDLTHNGEKESHIEIAKKLAKIEESGVTVLVTAGNHDINNPYAREFKGSEEVVTETVTPEEFEQIYYEFGFSDAAARDEKTLSYLSKVSEDLWVLMLDSNLYRQNTTAPVTNGILNKSTLDWVRNIGDQAKAEDVEILGVMHHNLYNHSDILYQGFTIGNAKDVLEVFKDSGINLVLSGHIHVQDIASDAEKTVFDVVTSGFIVSPVTYGKLTYSKEDGFTYKTEKLDVESWVESTNNTDEYLQNFEENSSKQFYDSSFDGVYKMLMDTGIVTDEEAKEMAEVMAVLNMHYFGGTVKDIDSEIGYNIAESNGYKLWVEHQDEFFSDYVISMEETRNREATSLELSAEDLKK